MLVRRGILKPGPKWLLRPPPETGKETALGFLVGVRLSTHVQTKVSQNPVWDLVPMNTGRCEQVEPRVDVVNWFESGFLPFDHTGLVNCLSEIRVLPEATPDEIEALVFSVSGDQVAVHRIAKADQAWSPPA